MDRYLRISYFTGCLLLASCAQVGVISGGEKDVHAPKIRKSEPPDLSTNFTSKSIEIEFDEYFKLENPNDNIQVLPAGVKVPATVHKKTLHLEIEGELKANTTYHITFNSAVKDFSEGNDSLMHYVFSTGSFVDSLSYSGFIADAYSGEKLPQVLVGLYDPDSTNLKTAKPVYFAKTDAEGKFEIKYLSPGTYRIFAFNDLNKDLSYQFNEKTGFRDSILHLNESVFDSVPLPVFISPGVEKISTKQLKGSKLYVLGANFPLANAVFTYNNRQLDSTSVFQFSKDSVALLFPDFPGESNTVLVQYGSRTDTLTFFYSANRRIEKVNFEVFPDNKDLSLVRESTLLFHDELLSLDSALIEAFTLDTVAVPFRYVLKKNRLEFHFPDTLSENFNLKFNPGALKFSNGTSNDALSVSYVVKTESSFGSLLFKTAHLPENMLIEFIVNKKVVLVKSVSSLMENPLVPFLEPGEYSFRIILDENKNQKWDSGNILELKQAEKTISYPATVKVRANWETEIEFELRK